LTESTTVKVSKETVRKLAALQRSFHTRSMDETIEVLVKRRRKEILGGAFGSDAKPRKFAEEDRLEDRS
jgi:predicted CopG family antitoxin